MYYVNSCWCAANSNCFLELHGILQYFQSLTDWITDREPTVQRTNCRNIVKFQGQRCTQLQCLSDTWKLLKTTTTCLATHEIRKKKFAFKYKRLMLNTGFKNTKFPFSTHIEWFEEWMRQMMRQVLIKKVTIRKTKNTLFKMTMIWHRTGAPVRWLFLIFQTMALKHDNVHNLNITEPPGHHHLSVPDPLCYKSGIH